MALPLAILIYPRWGSLIFMTVIVIFEEKARIDELLKRSSDQKKISN